MSQAVAAIAGFCTMPPPHGGRSSADLTPLVASHNTGIEFTTLVATTRETIRLESNSVVASRRQCMLGSPSITNDQYSPTPHSGFTSSVVRHTHSLTST